MKPDKQIKKSGEVIREVMIANLELISESIIKKIMVKYRGLTDSKKADAIKNINPSNTNAYKSDLKATLAVVSSDALDSVRKEVPTENKVKLMENEHRLLFGEFDNLPPKIKKRINTASGLLIATQIADLEKAIYFQYTSSVESDKPEKEIEFDMDEKASTYIGGNAIAAGSAVTAANMINEVRSAFFDTDDALEEIEAFEFMNGDPVSPICSDLAGTIFDKNDPSRLRYTPPLHFNCKSWIRPILRLNKNQEIEKLQPSTKEAADSIQFADFLEASGHDCQTMCCIHL